LTIVSHDEGVAYNVIVIIKIGDKIDANIDGDDDDDDFYHNIYMYMYHCIPSSAIKASLILYWSFSSAGWFCKFGRRDDKRPETVW